MSNFTQELLANVVRSTAEASHAPLPSALATVTLFADKIKHRAFTLANNTAASARKQRRSKKKADGDSAMASAASTRQRPFVTARAHRQSQLYALDARKAKSAYKWTEMLAMNELWLAYMRDVLDGMAASGGGDAKMVRILKADFHGGIIKGGSYISCEYMSGL